MTTWRSIALAFAALLPAAAPAQGIDWQTDYTAAMQQARTSGLPLLLFVVRPNDPACRQADEQTFRAAAVVQGVRGNFVPLRVERDRYEKLADDLSGQTYPTVLLATAKGRILDVHKGPLEAAA